LNNVDELINPYSGEWDEELLRENFWAIDVNNIMSIPLNLNGMDDFITWRFNKNGLFSVRSTFHMEWESRFGKKLRRIDVTDSARPNPVG
jgi:hypothetical protein